MFRQSMIGLALVVLMSSILGCGRSPTVKKEDPFRSRADTRKESARENFMKPHTPDAPPKK
jgi:hypothetical protein